MRKYLSYILTAAAMVLLALLIIISNSRRKQKWDERITLKQVDKIPYGTSVAKELLPYIFPKASVYFDKNYPNYWDSVYQEDTNQAVILVANHFDADAEELDELFSFAAGGNYVFVAARSFSHDALELLHFSLYQNSFAMGTNVADDSLQVQLDPLVFGSRQTYVYPGKKYSSSFYSIDTVHTKVLGRSKTGLPNFVQFNVGKGLVFVHVAPLAFSNYFILHKNNIDYFESALSVIPSHVQKVLWNEYYLVKPQGGDKEPNWLGVLMKFPAFRWALITGTATILLLCLLGMRRRQRMIPHYNKPANASLDFVKTLGRLYYEQGNNKDLAGKMSMYFMEHVRTKYKLATQVPDEAFVQKLHQKTGYPKEAIEQLVRSIRQLEQASPVSDEQLFNFHKQVELFYKNT
jgi:hypothetical protein